MKRTEIVKGQCYNVVIEKKQRLAKVMNILTIEPPVQEHFSRKQQAVQSVFTLIVLGEGRAVQINDASKFRSVA